MVSTKFIDVYKISQQNIENVKKFLKENFGDENITVEELKKITDKMNEIEKLETIYSLTCVVDGSSTTNFIKEIDKKMKKVSSVVDKFITEEVLTYLSMYDFDHYESAIVDDITNNILEHVSIIVEEKNYRLSDIIRTYPKYNYIVTNIRNNVEKEVKKFFRNSRKNHEEKYYEDMYDNDEFFMQEIEHIIQNTAAMLSEFDSVEFLSSLTLEENQTILEELKSKKHQIAITLVELYKFNENNFKKNKEYRQIFEEISNMLLRMKTPLSRRNGNETVEQEVSFADLVSFDQEYYQLFIDIVNEASSVIWNMKMMK